MSYLDMPRLTFFGHFQADVSTVNNNVGNFDNATFSDVYQQLNFEGSWNPEGTGIFRVLNCQITGARLGNEHILTSEQDSVIGMMLENADDRVFGKLVDLDPQQQMCSQIWGMRLRLTDGVEPAFFAGSCEPAAFTNLWLRQQQATAPNDQQLAAVYQSVLGHVQWAGASKSRVLDALRAASQEGALSINMNVYGFGRDPSRPRYTMGRVAGAIGPYRSGEPKHFVFGRQMVAAQDLENTLGAVTGVYTFQAKVDSVRKVLTADFGNSLQIVDADGPLADVGRLQMAVLKTQPDQPLDHVEADQIALLGEVPYRVPDWYMRTAGVQDFDYSADPWCVANIAQYPLLLIGPKGKGNTYGVMVQETLGGLYVRADDFVRRLNPAATDTVELYATDYGKPFQGEIALSVNKGMMGGTRGAKGVPPPAIQNPAEGLTYPASLSTDTNGKAVLTMKAGVLSPPKPRGYIEGQLYGIGYQLTAQPAQTIADFWNFISVLVFSPGEAPEQPTWYANIEPIFRQYGNLYPIMSKHLVRLGQYDSVVEHLNVLRLAFSLPLSDPNHMPVTRDLSDSNRAMILKWMSSPGPEGLPVKGEPVRRVALAPLATVPSIDLKLAPLQERGKMAVMLEYAARAKVEKQP